MNERWEKLKEWAEPKVKEDEENLQKEIAESKARGDPWWKQPINMKYKKKWYMYDIDDPDPNCSTEEFGEWVEKIMKRSEETRELRAELLMQEQPEIKKACEKVFGEKQDATGTVKSKQVKEMMESIGYGVTMTELHYVLRVFDGTDGFNMLPDVEFDSSKFQWLVAELHQLKQRFDYYKPEDWVMDYENYVMSLEMQKEAGLEGTEEWPHIKPFGAFWPGGKKPGYRGPKPEYTGPPNYTAEQRAKLKAEYEKEKAEREALRPEWYKRKLKKQADKEKSQLKVKEKK
jgi:hypothetical protein